MLATSASVDELEALLSLLEVDQYTFAVTSSEDVAKAKPEPDIITVALQKGDIDATNAIMLGDSVWDIAAATKAGVRSIGLLSGGTGEDDLMQAGPIAVYDTAHDLQVHLENSILTTIIPVR